MLLLTKTFARSAENEVTHDMILADPEAPTGGNPNGDLTIVDFFDYNCPYCKKSATHLERLVKADGKIKLIYKDWPILAETSIIGAQASARSEISGQISRGASCTDEHPGIRDSREQMIDAVRKSGIDLRAP